MSSLRNANAPAGTEAKANKPLACSGAAIVPAELIAYQGDEQIPAGKRLTRGRQALMLKAVDESSLPRKYRAVIKIGVVQFADQDGVFFVSQDEWGDACGCSREFVNDAVKAAVEARLMKKMERVYTKNGRKGTSIYALHPETWSRDAEAVGQSMNARLRHLTITVKDPSTVCPTGTPSVCLTGTTERDVLLRSSPPTDEKRKSSSDEESDYSLGREPETPAPSIDRPKTKALPLKTEARAAAIDSVVVNIDNHYRPMRAKLIHYLPDGDFRTEEVVIRSAEQEESYYSKGLDVHRVRWLS
jgi:hypothetical protein